MRDLGCGDYSAPALGTYATNYWDRTLAGTRVVILAAATALGLGGCAARAAMPTAPAQTAPVDEATQVAQYVQVQEALAADDFARAKSSLEGLVPLVDAPARALAENAADAETMATMRERFKALSELMTQQAAPAGYAKAYCPMFEGGAPWFQKDGPIRNPYFGAAMLTCGVVDAAPGAHMDHSPRHGGTVFMAPDSFHHIEGAYPQEGVFRVYATDNFREPVNVSGWSGRAVLEEVYDEATDTFREVTGVELAPSPDGAYLEAKVGNLSVPTEVSARVIFQEDFPAERFDFIFANYSTESAETPGRGPMPMPAVGGGDPPESIPLAERIRPEIPADTGTIVSEIASRHAQIKELIGRGAFMEIFIPALQAKELALALSDRADSLPEGHRNAVRIAVRSLVRAAWLLDWYGDLGNKQQVNDAYSIFGAAVSDITRVYDAQ